MGSFSLGGLRSPPKVLGEFHDCQQALLDGWWAAASVNGSSRAIAQLVRPCSVGYPEAMQSHPIYCGLDFGTSNSTVAIVTGGTTRLVPLENDRTSVPSAIFYPAEGEPPLYGRAAVVAYTDRKPGRLLRSLKSILGSDLIAERTAVGSTSRSFESILVGYVRYLKDRAESFAGSKITAVVMGRPVHFVDGNDAVDARAERKLGDIARAAGFEQVAFQYEPIAAALAFEDTLEADERVLVADLGGGTADFSVVEVGPQRRRQMDRAGDILANGGVRVGGTNFDMRLSLAAVMPHLGSRSKTLTDGELPRWPFVDLSTWHMIHRLDAAKSMTLLREILDDCAEPGLFRRLVEIVERRNGHRLAGLVEAAKIDLTTSDNCQIELDQLAAGVRVAASRALFERAICEELEKLAATAKSTIAASSRPASSISAMFLTGGTSTVPAVRLLLQSLLPTAKLVEGDLFNSVGFGLALDARRRYTQN